METVCIGKIINTFGLKGEVKIESYSDFDEIRYQKGNTVYIENDGKMEPFAVESFRIHKGYPLVSFAKYKDINLIEQYKGCLIYVEKTSRPPLKENEFYQTDLIGLQVYDENDNSIGEIIDVEPTHGAQNNLRIQQKDGTVFLIPFLPEFIKKVELDQKKVIVHMEEGLL